MWVLFPTPSKEIKYKVTFNIASGVSGQISRKLFSRPRKELQHFPEICRKETRKLEHFPEVFFETPEGFTTFPGSLSEGGIKSMTQ